VEAKARPKQLVLEKLPYKIDDLAPVLSKANVEYHYGVLSNGYVTRYNDGEGDPDFKEEKYKSKDGLLDAMIKKAMSLQGSGWMYLAKNGELKNTPNQSYKTDILMPIDMWEHSFMDYVPAKDAKKRYITAVMRIINWSVINDRLNTK
jgi:superoxide dismutase